MGKNSFDVRVDGDTILCRAGFSADSNSDEMSHSLYNCKLIINMLKSKFPGKMTIYLSGASKDCNFRYNLTDTYKSNRTLKCRTCKSSNIKPMKSIQNTGTRYIRAFECVECGFNPIPDTKPVWYQEIRSYLIAKYDAKVIDWGEADDWLGVNVRTNTVIVSNDKDLLMLPAYHYRLSSEKLIQTSDPGQLWLSDCRKKLLGGGFKWFVCQMLMGDSIDGIKKPHKGYGPVKVYDIMKGVTSARAMWDIVEKHYYPDADQMLLNAQLLWISRKPRQQFSLELVEELIQEIDSAEQVGTSSLQSSGGDNREGPAD